MAGTYNYRPQHVRIRFFYRCATTANVFPVMSVSSTSIVKHYFYRNMFVISVL